MRNNITAISGLAVILLVVCLIYLPGLRGPFVLDDPENITEVPSIAISKIDMESLRRIWNVEAFMSHKRPLTSLTFALNYHWAGGFESTWSFKTTNLLIHAINAVLIFGILLLLLSAPRIRESLSHPARLAVAMLGTALWAVHPIQLTNILYVVQRMNSLSALFVLAGLVLYLLGRHRLSATPAKALWLMVGGTLGGMSLGIAAKENAALLPLYLLVIEYTIFSRDDLAPRTRRHLYLFLAFCLSLPLILFVTYLGTHPEFISSAFTARRFTAYERLLTEGRVLWYYIGLLFIPSTQRMSLFHDDISLSHGLFDPLSTFVAALGIAAALAFSLLNARRFPVAAFAILWFLVGHSMESTVLNLEIAYEHRNYLPGLGVFFALAYGLIVLSKAGASRKIIWYGLAAGMVVMLGTSTWVRANSWKDLYTFAITEAQHHPGSERANDFAARVSFNEKNDIAEALHYTLLGINAAPREVGFLIDMHILLAQVPSQYPVTVGGRSIPPELISPEIVTRLLKDEPLSVHGVVSFENLTRCTLAPPYSCGTLRGQATHWLKVAADESRTSDNYRAILAADAARFFAAAGDYQQAYTYINRAADQYPHLASYKLGVAEYALKLGCFGQVKPMIEQIEQILRQNPPNQTNKASLDKLKEMYNESAGPESGFAHTAGHLCYKKD